jgi:hypothetical protein
MLIKGTVMFKSYRILLYLSLMLSVCNLASAQAQVGTKTKSLSKSFFSVDGQDLASDANISDFAISPDRSKIVVSFGESEKGKVGMWLTELTLVDKQVIGKCHISDGVALFVSLDHSTIQYTPDGAQIIVQSESSLYSIDASSMKVLYSMSIPTTVHSASEARTRRFIISKDGKTIGVFFGQSIAPEKNGSVILLDAKTGNKLAEWPVPSQVQSFSFSLDEKQILMSALNPPDAVDMFLMDSRSGQIIKRFESGFPIQQVMGAGLNAIFLDEAHFVAVANNVFDKRGKYVLNPIKVFDVATGKVSKTFTYDKLAPAPGDIWISDGADKLAVLSSWMSSWSRRFTEGGAKHSNLIFFKIAEPASLCVIGPLPEENVKQSGFIRSSTDLEIIGLYQAHTIRLYKIPGGSGSS